MSEDELYRKFSGEELICDKCKGKTFTGKYGETAWYEDAVYMFYTDCGEELMLVTS